MHSVNTVIADQTLPVMVNVTELPHDSNSITSYPGKLELGRVVYCAIDDTAIFIFQWLVYSVLCQALDLFGIATNIINILCFIKQGFKDPVNISLFGLAISDMGSLVTLVWLNIAFNPSFMNADLPFDTIEFQYLSGGLLHTAFTRVTGWITALITLERCVCIVAPLKVHSIVTPRRVSIIVICAFIILLGSGAPVYVVNRLDYKFYPARNKTLIGMIHTEDTVEKISYLINNAILPFSSFIVTAVCTIVLVVNLKKRTRWRKMATASMQGDQVSNRNEKVAKMVVMISTLFIACFIPISMTFLGMSLEPELSFDGKHRNSLILIGGLGLVLESINSSVNIFFYYRMSSRYRDAFHQLFSKLKK